MREVGRIASITCCKADFFFVCAKSGIVVERRSLRRMMWPVSWPFYPFLSFSVAFFFLFEFRRGLLFRSVSPLLPRCFAAFFYAQNCGLFWSHTTITGLLLGSQFNHIAGHKPSSSPYYCQTNMANFLQFSANTHNAAMPAVSSSGASSSDDRYRPSLPLPSTEKLQVDINTDTASTTSKASSSSTSTVACADVGSIDSFMDDNCDAGEHDATCNIPTIPSSTTNNSRCTFDQALDNLMQRRKSERHYLSIARDLLETLEDDEEDFTSEDDSRTSTSEIRMPNIKRGLRSLAQPKRREIHPFAVAEFFLQDLEEEE